MKEAWVKRLRERYEVMGLAKDYRALKGAEEYFEENIRDLVNCGLPVYQPIAIDYDLMNYINKMLEDWCVYNPEDDFFCAHGAKMETRRKQMYEELVKSLREKAEFLTVADGNANLKNQFADTMKEAADAIEAMCEMVALAHGENANLIESIEENRLRWTPVTEVLPKEDGDYWVYNESGEQLVVTYDSCIDEESERFGFWREYYNPETLGYEDSEWFPIYGITHWMKKPEPPDNSVGGQ